MNQNATMERTSDRELVVMRTVNGSARSVYAAWTDAKLFERWWVPRSFPVTLLSCEIDARMGGGYRLVFGHEGQSMEFFGRYLEVVPNARLVWTNDEGDDEPVTTVTFEDLGSTTRVVVHDLYPSKEALDAAIASGSAGIAGMPEQLEQLEELLTTLETSEERSESA